MRIAVTAVALLAGCDQLFDIDPVLKIPDAPPINGDAFGMLVDSAACGGTSYGMYGPGGSGLLRVCVTGTVPATITLPSPLSTDSAANCAYVIALDTIGTEVCVIVAQNIMINSIVNTVGARGLVLVATESLTINARVDVAGHRLGSGGAASNWSGCQVSNGHDSGAGGGGAPGGSNGTRGGSGGGGAGGVGVAARATIDLDRIRGGCPGGEGGTGGGGVPGGRGGVGGGALYLIAGVGIRLGALAVINASGGGGQGGAAGPGTDNGAGGGGGGAGGFVGFDSPVVGMDADAKVLANGGGGGAGGAPAVPGGSGSDPSSDAVLVPALGAPGTGLSTTKYGGGGGNGYAGELEATTGYPSKSGGGGGGGGGYIRIYSDTVMRTLHISPPPG